MFTVCPKCALTLVVTAADLRVAQGYVRCGRCSSVFNALARLTDERAGAISGEGEPPPDEPAEPEPQTPPAAAAPESDELRPLEDTGASDAEEEAIPDDALEFDPTRTDVAAVFVDPPPNPQWTAATGSFKAMIAAQEEAPAEAPPDPALEVEVDAAFLASMLRSDVPDATAARARGGASERRSAATSAAQPAAAATAATPAAAAPSKPHEVRPRTAPAVPPPARSHPGTARHATPHARPHFEAKALPPEAERPGTAISARTSKALAVEEPAQPTSDAEAGELPAVRESGILPPRIAPQVWRIGAAAGVILLLAQIINHYRDDLAATARFNRPLTALYGALGVRLAPHWDVRAYDVRQLGASVEPGGTGLITVRASIKNGAQHPQPLPLLRVTLEDRFGNRIASSDVAPRFYLPPAVPASSFLSGGQRIDAEMGFVDPGADAVGFEIDACLPASSGGVTCANDVSTR